MLRLREIASPVGKATGIRDAKDTCDRKDMEDNLYMPLEIRVTTITSATAIIQVKTKFKYKQFNNLILCFSFSYQNEYIWK